jgi:hypothetical protein
MITYNQYAATMRQNKLSGSKNPMPSGYGTANHAFGPDSYYTPNKHAGGSDGEQEHDELYDQYQSRKIGPFSFDIDDEIDTEVLTSDEVYRDLKELEGILAKNDSELGNLASKMLGAASRSKKKK